MTIMETREALEEAGTDATELTLLQTDNARRIDQAVADLSGAFSSADLNHANRITHLLVYFQRIARQIKEQMPIR